MSRGSTPGTAEVWLATPEAAALFDPSRLDSVGHAQWAAIQTRRRQVDWASSRALLDAVPNGGDQNRSLSHSHGFSALALVPGAGRVGIDVEWQAPRDFKGMASIAYSDAERDYLESLENTEDLRRDLLPLVDAEGSVREGAGAASGGCAQAVLLCRRVRHAPCRSPDDGVLASNGLCASSAIATGRSAHA